VQTNKKDPCQFYEVLIAMEARFACLEALIMASIITQLKPTILNLSNPREKNQFIFLDSNYWFGI
jgi:hypothetical protein